MLSDAMPGSDKNFTGETTRGGVRLERRPGLKLR
jgi:hypothetical protein